MAMERENIVHKSATNAIRHIYKQEGLRGFYAGMAPSLIGIMPYHGTGFFMYHLLKGNLIKTYPEWRRSKSFDFAFGAIAGLFAQLSKIYS